MKIVKTNSLDNIHNKTKSLTTFVVKFISTNQKYKNEK